MEVIATLAVAATFSWALEAHATRAALQAWQEIAVSCALLFVVAWTGTLLHAMGRWDAVRRWAFTVGGALVVGIYGWTLADFSYDAETWRAVQLLAAAVMWLVALPAFGRRGGSGEERTERTRRVDGRFALRVVGAVLYGAALFAGLALALAAVDNLFELKLEEEIYGHVWGWISFVLIPWIVLGGLEDYIRTSAGAGPAGTGAGGDASRVTGSGPVAGTSSDVTSPGTMSSGLGSVAFRIALWLVPPLLVLYTLILYAYAVRIVVTGEIPKNLVSPMVLAAGGLGSAALLLFDPRPGRGGLARGLRLAPALFLPLAPLGYWALWIRIHEYGWTEFRMVRVVALSGLVALAVGATVQLARRRAFSLHVAPVVLAGVLLLSALGPWSALAFSRRSQQARLARALSEVGIAPAAGTAPGLAAAATAGAEADSSRIVPAAVYKQIRESARYLAGHFGRSALPAGLAAFPVEEPIRVDYAARLGLRPDSPSAREGLVIGGTLERGTPVEIVGGTAYRVSWTRGGTDRPEGAVAPGDRNKVAVALRDRTRLELGVDGRLLTAELGPLMRELERSAYPAVTDRLPSELALMPLTDAAGKRAGDFVVWDLRAWADSAGWRPQRVEGWAVVSGR